MNGRDTVGLERNGQQPCGHLLAGSDNCVIFARVVKWGDFAYPVNQLVGGTSHGGDDDCDLVASINLAFDVRRHLADALDVCDGGAAEFHNDYSHDVL